MKPDLIAPAWRQFWRFAFPMARLCSRDELHRLAKAARMFAEHADRIAQSNSRRAA